MRSIFRNRFLKTIWSDEKKAIVNQKNGCDAYPFKKINML